MKHLKSFIKFPTKPEQSSVSKKRKWPMISPGGKRKGHPFTDKYFIYDLNKNELGKYLNIWFEGDKLGDGDKVYCDEMITVKKVDSETASRLYHKRYNPVSIRISCPVGAKFLKDEEGNDLYNMKATIHSIDDSSYGISWEQFPIDVLKQIRLNLMDWINGHGVLFGSELNGEEFFEICISMGADEETKDYS